MYVVGAYAPCVRRCERPNPEPWWSELWRARTPGEHRRTTSAWPGVGSSLNGLPGGAKLRSGRAGRLPASPVSVGWGRYVRHTSVCRGDRTSDRRDPPSQLMSPGSTFGWARAAKSWRGKVKAVVKILQALRRRRSESEPARKKRPARAGAAPREGKALEGRSRNASGMEQGREASGSTANGGVQKTSSEPRDSWNRREGQEP
jgi:hypothetical protein